MPKLTVLGGSSIATPELLNALTARAERPALRIVLHGRDADKLERVARICAMMASRAHDVRVEWTTDLSRALDGADVVLNQIRVGGLQARAFDESFPHAFDIPGEETVGPGGFANALRTVPVCLKYAWEIEKRAPQAWLINLANPAGIVQAAVERASRVRVVSVCDSPVTQIEQVGKLLGVDARKLHVEYVGMLHFGFIVGMTHDGIDVMPRVLELIAQLPGLVADPRVFQAMGVVPSPYLNYFLAPELMLARQRAKGHTRARELQDLETQILQEYTAGNFSNLVKRAAVWYEKIIVPVLLSLLASTKSDEHPQIPQINTKENGLTNDTDKSVQSPFAPPSYVPNSVWRARNNESAGEMIVNTRNRQSVPFLPQETIVEVRAQVSPQGIIPYVTTAVPRDVQAMLQTNAAYEALVVEAILEESYDKAWRALRLNPLVSSAAKAREMLDVIVNNRD